MKILNKIDSREKKERNKIPYKFMGSKQAVGSIPPVNKNAAKKDTDK
jgi:hypothetical protein